MATRIDSWCGALDTYKQAEIYLKWIGRDPDVTWEKFVAWAVEEYELDRTPSRNAFYAWAAKPGESNDYKGGAGYRAWKEWQRDKLVESGKYAEELVKSCPEIAEDDILRNVKVLFTEAMNLKDFKASASLSTSFAQIIGSVLDRQKLRLTERAQQTKEDQLRLAREKFEFDAAKKAMELAAEIKDVAGDDSLDDDEKIAKVREALFG